MAPPVRARAARARADDDRRACAHRHDRHARAWRSIGLLVLTDDARPLAAHPIDRRRRRLAAATVTLAALERPELPIVTPIGDEGWAVTTPAPSTAAPASVAARLPSGDDGRRRDRHDRHGLRPDRRLRCRPPSPATTWPRGPGAVRHRARRRASRRVVVAMDRARRPRRRRGDAGARRRRRPGRAVHARRSRHGAAHGGDDARRPRSTPPTHRPSAPTDRPRRRPTTPPATTDAADRPSPPTRRRRRRRRRRRTVDDRRPDEHAQRRRRRQRRTRLTATPVATSDGRDHAGQRQLLAPLRRDHRPPLGLGALDVRLLVGHRRPPAVRLQPVVGDEPRLTGVAAQARRDRAPLEPPAQRADDLGDPVGQPDARPGAGQRAHPLAGDPPVGRDVEHAVEAPVDGERDGRREVVEVEELGRRVVLADALAEARRRARAASDDVPSAAIGDDRPQHGDRAAGHGRGASRRPSPRRSPAGGRRRTRRRGAGWRPR